MLKQVVKYALLGSVVDLAFRRIPVYWRSTPIWVEEEVDGSISLQLIESFAPAIKSSDSALIVEPAGINLIDYNHELQRNVWIKGADVDVSADRGTSPTGTLQAERISFLGTDTAPSAKDLQTLKRSFSLKADKDYIIWGYVMLLSGSFAANEKNVIQMVGADDAVLGQFYLSDLNAKKNKYQTWSIQFHTPGTYPASLPWEGETDAPKFTVTAVSGNTITLNQSGLEALSANQLVGTTLKIQGPPTTPIEYPVIGNNASTGDTVVVTVSTGVNLAGLGVTTSSKGYILNPKDEEVTFEMYSTSIAQMLAGGIFLEERSFRTSPIYNLSNTLFARDEIEFRTIESPIASSSDFGFYMGLTWRGDGNIVNCGNFSIAIDAGDLLIKANAVEIRHPSPDETLTFFVQVSAASGQLSLYIDKVLIARVSLSGFSGSQDVNMNYSSEGYREIREFIITTRSLLDGSPALLEVASEEVAEIFDTDIISASDLSATSPTFALPITYVPGKTNSAETIVIAKTSSNATVAKTTGFAQGQTVEIYRGIPGQENAEFVATTTINGAISGSTIPLADTTSLKVNDYLVIPSKVAGSATVRYPYTPIDRQTITAIDVANRWLTISTAASMKKARAFIESDLGDAIAEVLIEEVDLVNTRVKVNRIGSIQVGHLIAQPKLNTELIIPPAIVDAHLAQEINGISLERYANGIRIVNNNFDSAAVQVVAQVIA